MNSPVFLFDVDWVAVRDNWYFSEHFCRARGLPVDFFAAFFREDFPQAIVGAADARERMAARLADTALDGRTDEVFDAWFEYNGIVNADILDFADRLRRAGHPVALATNQEKYRVAYLLDTLGLGDFFDAVYPSCEIGAKKPDADYYSRVGAAVRERWGERPIALIDDQAPIISAAEAAGWRGYRFDQDAPDALEKLEKAFAKYLPKE